jgi:hypothetical protein
MDAEGFKPAARRRAGRSGELFAALLFFLYIIGKEYTIEYIQ